jgi:propanol-preferring alcohol dehydrogenase
MMKAFRLVDWKTHGQLLDVPVPEPKAGEVLIKVAGAGICCSDLHILQEWDDTHYHAIALGVKPPFTLGHENSGWVAALGPGTTGFEVGQTVLSTVSGCGQCKFCALGQQSYCLNLKPHPGLGHDGGLAEYMVWDANGLVPFRSGEPWMAAPLTDAGFTAYHAVKRVLPILTPDSAVVVIGIGGLGHMAVAILKAVCGARIIAVDNRDVALSLAKNMGADDCLLSDNTTGVTIREITRGVGAVAVLDFVGMTPTMLLATQAVAMQGQIVVCGLGGGSVELAYSSLPFGATICFELGGTKADLMEVVGLFESGLITPVVERFPLSKVQTALDKLENGEIIGRAVIVPEE